MQRPKATIPNAYGKKFHYVALARPPEDSENRMGP